MKKIKLLISLYLLMSSLSFGQCFWAKTFGNGTNTERITSIKSKNGYVYTTGYFEGNIDFDPGSGVLNLTSAGLKDIFISKLDSQGNFIWAKRIGSTQDDEAYSITVDNQQNIVVVGGFRETVDFDPNSGIVNLTAGLTTSGTISGFILKLDQNGNYQNAVKLSTNNVGSGGVLTCTTVDYDLNGNLIVGGYFSSAVEYDNNGNPFDVYYDFNPGSGTSTLNARNGSNFILKLNTSLSFIWAKNFGNMFYSIDYKPELSVSNNGNIYFTHLFGGVIDFDPGAGISNLTALGSTDIFVIKFNQNGVFQWVKQLGSNNGYHEYSRDIRVDLNENIVITGSFGGTVDFDPGTSILTYTAAGYRDGFIWKLNSLGNLVFAKILVGSATAQVEPYGLDLDNNSNIYTIGWNNASTDFDPGPSVFIIPGGSGGAFISKLDINGDFVWARRFSGTGSCLGTDISYSNNRINSSGYFNGVIDFDPSANIFNLTSLDVFVHQIVDYVPPTITASGPTSFCAGGTVTLTSSSLTGNIWSNGATTQSITVSQAGNYSLSVTIGSCLAASSTTTVTVNPSPNIPIVTANGPLSLCTGASVTLTSSSLTGNLWSNGATTQSITVSQAGSYFVSVSNGTCSATSQSVTVNIITAAAPTGAATQTFCNGATISNLVANGTNVQWYSTASSGTALSSSTQLVNGSTYYAAQTVSGCQSNSRLAVTVTIINTAAPTGSAVQAFCNGATIANLVAVGSNVQWFSTASGGTPLSASTALANGVTYYAAQTVSGCISTSRLAVRASVSISSAFSEICLVSVDNNDGKNIVIWEKAANQRIRYYKIYKQNTVNSQYDSIALVPIDSFSTFKDFNSNPSQQSNSYKISAVDSCGIEGPVLSAHTTIHLTANQGVNNNVNLLWNAYSGFSYPNFEIYRSNNGSSFTLIGTVSNSSFSYTDLTPPAGTNYYYVSVVKPTPCNPSKSAAVLRSISNTLDGLGNSVISATENTVNYNSYNIYPNPTTSIINIEKTGNISISEISIYDVLGRKLNTILPGNHSVIQMEMPQIPGTYYISIEEENGKRELFKVLKI